MIKSLSLTSPTLKCDIRRLSRVTAFVGRNDCGKSWIFHMVDQLPIISLGSTPSLDKGSYSWLMSILKSDGELDNCFFQLTWEWNEHSHGWLPVLVASVAGMRIELATQAVPAALTMENDYVPRWLDFSNCGITTQAFASDAGLRLFHCPEGAERQAFVLKAMRCFGFESMYPHEHWWKTIVFKGPDGERIYDILTSGQRTLLLVALAVAMAKGKLLILEYPDSGIHPELFPVLANVLRQNDCHQLFITTNNPYLLDHLEPDECVALHRVGNVIHARNLEDFHPVNGMTNGEVWSTYGEERICLGEP